MIKTIAHALSFTLHKLTLTFTYLRYSITMSFQSEHKDPFLGTRDENGFTQKSSEEKLIQPAELYDEQFEYDEQCYWMECFDEVIAELKSDIEYDDQLYWMECFDEVMVQFKSDSEYGVQYFWNKKAFSRVIKQLERKIRWDNWNREFVGNQTPSKRIFSEFLMESLVPSFGFIRARAMEFLEIDCDSKEIDEIKTAMKCQFDFHQQFKYVLKYDIHGEECAYCDSHRSSCMDGSDEDEFCINCYPRTSSEWFRFENYYGNPAWFNVFRSGVIKTIDANSYKCGLLSYRHYEYFGHEVVTNAVMKECYYHMEKGCTKCWCPKQHMVIDGMCQCEESGVHPVDHLFKVVVLSIEGHRILNLLNNRMEFAKFAMMIYQFLPESV